MNTRGFSLVELLISMALTLILLAAVGAAIMQTLHLQAFHAGRAGMSRTVANLSERLGEEARSSTAIFIPSTDVLGAPNDGLNAHEVDFFRRLSAGGDAFVAYRFDKRSGTVDRYEYTFSSGAKTVSSEDVAADNIVEFNLSRLPVSTVGPIVGESHPIDVSIMYGKRELVGGNSVIVVAAKPQERDGIPGQTMTIHLATKAAPTALAILTAKTPPATPPPGTDSIPFVVLHPGYPVSVPHAPVHGGGADGPTMSRWVAAAGSVKFLGARSDAGTWFEFTAIYPRVESGIYTFKAPDGSSITAIVGCGGGPCPAFAPLPVSAPAFTTAGSVAFRLTP